MPYDTNLPGQKFIRLTPFGHASLPILAALVAIFVLLPVAGLIWNALQLQSGTNDAFGWKVLAEFAFGSLLLSGGVAAGVIVTGALPAWLVAQFEFPGRRWLEWMLVLPLAMPAYIMAYAYADFLQYAGPLQSALRDWFGWQTRTDYWFPDIRTLPGAVLILTLGLYPYVYVLARIAFMEQPQALLEAARVAGLGRLKVLWRVALPVARPAIMAGAA
ncbi:MAG: iron ABC transporter permease, partial [Betaproteobacteria bacterium]|nr:iron ABC transporter permease [Betaproteobacteria bacterium]